MMIDPLKVFLVDDHAVVRAGYRLLLEGNPGIEVIAELENGEDAYHRLESLKPDVIIMDLSMPGIGGLEAIRRIKQRDRKVKILVFTMHDTQAFVEHALNAGADGYITKNSAPNILLTAVQKVAFGEKYIEPALEEGLSLNQSVGDNSPLSVLSRREFQIFCRFAEGRNAGDIAEELSLSIKTVANYQTRIREKLGITSSSDLVKLAISQGIIEV